jgi:hypothetical protein
MNIRAIAFTLSALLLCASSAVMAAPSQPVAEQHRPHGGSLDVRRHGYEHGYRDGFQFGQHDRSTRAAYQYQTNQKYVSGEAGYEEYMGDKAQFAQGYRSGFRVGYTDAFYGSRGRFAEIYGNPGPPVRFLPDQPDQQEDSIDDVYAKNKWSVQDVAFDVAYRDGIVDGENDRLYSADREPTFHARYRRANHGYRMDYGNEHEYQRLYRIAYFRGYGDGYQAARPIPEGIRFVSAPRVEKSTDTLAIIAWSTNVPTQADVYYTSDKFNYDREQSKASQSVHRVELKDLEPDVAYKVMVRITYKDLVKTSPPFEFKTVSKTKPILFTADGVPKIEEVTDKSAVVSWKTDIDSSGSLLYRTSSEGPSTLVDELSISREHRVKLTNLAPGTRYYFTIWSSPVCITNHEKFTFETKGDAEVAGKSAEANR